MALLLILGFQKTTNWPSGNSGSKLGPGELDTALPTTGHRCNIFAKGTLPGRSDEEMGPANSSHASAYYSEYNETFDLVKTVVICCDIRSLLK